MEKAVEMKNTEQNQPENYINKVTFRDKLREYKKHPKSLVVMILVMLSAVFAVGILLFLMIYILANGIPHLTAEQFEWKYTPDNQSMMPAIINTSPCPINPIIHPPSSCRTWHDGSTRGTCSAKSSP